MTIFLLSNANKKLHLMLCKMMSNCNELPSPSTCKHCKWCIKKWTLVRPQANRQPESSNQTIINNLEDSQKREEDELKKYLWSFGLTGPHPKIPQDKHCTLWYLELKL